VDEKLPVFIIDSGDVGLENRGLSYFTVINTFFGGSSWLLYLSPPQLFTKSYAHLITMLNQLLGFFVATKILASSAEPFLNGADVVAYYSLEAGEPAVIGSSEYSSIYTSYDAFDENSLNELNTTFYFANEDNLALFEADSMKYLPAYGGFCAFGVAFETVEDGGWPWSRNYVGAPGTPDIWRIDDDGRLYIAFIPGAMDGFFEDWPSGRDQADKRWRSWWGDASPSTMNGPFNTDCLGPPDTWAMHSCSNKPQQVPGVDTIPIVSEECIAALDKFCSKAAPSNPDVDILSSTCDECIDDNADDLMAGGCERNATSNYISNVVDKYYCK